MVHYCTIDSPCIESEHPFFFFFLVNTCTCTRHTHTHTCASQLHNYAHWDRVVISLPSSYIAMKNVFNTAILVSSMWYPSLLHICDINLLILACLLTNIPKLFSAVHTFPACLLFVVNIQTYIHTHTRVHVPDICLIWMQEGQAWAWWPTSQGTNPHTQPRTQSHGWHVISSCSISL